MYYNESRKKHHDKERIISMQDLTEMLQSNSGDRDLSPDIAKIFHTYHELIETQQLYNAAIKEITGGDSLTSNIQLVFNNAKLAAKTAAELSKLN